MKTQANQVRIIAGQWRGRKINFPEVLGLRPSADRVRESLFNWLMPYIGGMECLDVFAGSGVLGLEALSRGAASVIAIDQSIEAIRALQKNAAQLAAKSLECLCANGLKSLSNVKGPFDLIFLDPPFKQGLIEPCCKALEKNNLLKPEAFIYIEMERATPPNIPESWTLSRQMKTQQAQVFLYRNEI